MNKKVASEIIKAGFRALAKTYHPDMGGTHNAMIILTETHEALLKFIESGSWPRDGASGPGPRQSTRESWTDDFRDKAKGKSAGQGPELEAYGSKYCLARKVHCVGSSPKAIQVMFPGNPWPAWLPRSQLHSSNEILKEGDRGTLIISRWIAAQKGWSVK